jgi:uncharacterized membrane protein YphA (DoxX/SURF4 family)
MDITSTVPGRFGNRSWSLRRDGDRIAFLLLRTLFVVAPIAFGLDKFTGVLTDDWTRYLAPWIDSLVPGSADTAMVIVGIVEIVAGIVVAFAPRIGAPIVAVWLLGIIVSLISVGGYGDIALRDFGLFVAALSLTSLAWSDHARARSSRRQWRET